MSFIKIIYFFTVTCCTIYLWVLTHYKHTLNQWHVALMNQAMDTKVTLTAFRFFSQQVTLKSFVPTDLASTGNSKCLFRT